MAQDEFLLLNVPARQSRNYYDYLKANISEDSLIYVDAMFGGLDVCARLTAKNKNESEYLAGEIASLITKRSDTSEGCMLHANGFHKNDEPVAEENFILVIVESRDDFHVESHQRSLLQFLKRSSMMKKLRYAGAVDRHSNISDLPNPRSLHEVISAMRDTSFAVLEFQIDSLDDPRDLIMRKLQQYSSITSSRTFFAVNFGKEDAIIERTLLQAATDAGKNWADPLLKWKKLIGL